MDGATAHIRFRSGNNGAQFSATGGFQHAVIGTLARFSGDQRRFIWESNPDARSFITALACRLAANYWKDSSLQPGTRCPDYGNTADRKRFITADWVQSGLCQLVDNSAIRISGLDKNGEIRVMNFDNPVLSRPQYQTERRAWRSKRTRYFTSL